MSVCMLRVRVHACACAYICMHVYLPCKAAQYAKEQQELNKVLQNKL